MMGSGVIGMRGGGGVFHLGPGNILFRNMAAYLRNPLKIKGVTTKTPPVLSGAEAEQGAEIFGGAAREAGQNVSCLLN